MSRWIAPVKPNVWALAAAIVVLVYLCIEAQTGVLASALPALMESKIADEVRTAALHLLGVVAGMQFATIGIAGLVSWGIKLLDELEPEPTVPATTHERVVAEIMAGRRAAEQRLLALEAEAARQEEET